MSQKRLNELALILIEKEILKKIDYNKLINNFTSLKRSKNKKTTKRIKKNSPVHNQSNLANELVCKTKVHLATNN